ncbi:MAG: TRC40/GET3/ArsA family transport-energizing ATPase, partial [Bacillota bacterium]
MTSRHLFLTGKGGVGKTSVACAMAISLAKEGKKVLLVSTDPASNLDDVLETKVGQKPQAIKEVRGLWALNLDPEEAAREYREQVVGAYRGVLPEAVVASMEEQLSGACTVEIAAFDLFSGLLAEPEAADGFDHIVFDTAPTGHTLRLLALPKAWSGFLGANLHGTTCIGPLAGLQEKRQRYEKALSTLNDSKQTTLILVARPDSSSLAEAARAARELGEIGLISRELVVNGVLVTAGEDAMAGALKKQQAEALENMPEELKNVPRRIVALLPFAPVGIAGLELMGEELRQPGTVDGKVENIKAGENGSKEISVNIPAGLGLVVKELGKKEKGIVLVMGKGGVGKTTVAAATALALFDQGHRVHLSTTDPAAHLDMVLEGTGKTFGERFSVSRIDPEVEVKAYRQEVMTSLGSELDKEGWDLLAEDLASPCTEEIAIF